MRRPRRHCHPPRAALSVPVLQAHGKALDILKEIQTRNPAKRALRHPIAHHRVPAYNATGTSNGQLVASSQQRSLLDPPLRCSVAPESHACDLLPVRALQCATWGALRNRTFVMWDSAGCPSPGRRPGEGDVVATGPDGRKFLRYSGQSPGQELQGVPVECALYAGLSVEFVKDLPAAGELVRRLWRECRLHIRSFEILSLSNTC